MKNKTFNQINELIEWGLNTNKCPCCGISLKNVNAVGTGSFADGRFCSLDCYANFYYKKKHVNTEASHIRHKSVNQPISNISTGSNRSH